MTLLSRPVDLSTYQLSQRRYATGRYLCICVLRFKPTVSKSLHVKLIFASDALLLSTTPHAYPKSGRGYSPQWGGDCTVYALAPIFAFHRIHVAANRD
jgi:hypothetical protein